MPLSIFRQETVELLAYSPGLPTTNDLESTTKTITATSKPATADYSKSLTLPKPSDARLVATRIASRLQVTRDSGTSANLYCTVAVDSADGSANILFNAKDVQAAALQATDVTSGAVWDLLSDGAAHIFYFFFWVDAGDSVISLVQLWEGVGTHFTGPYDCMQINHSGLILVQMGADKSGSGTVRTYFAPNATTGDGATSDGQRRYSPADSGAPVPLTMQKTSGTFACRTSVSTDIVVCNLVWITLRSEQ